MTLANVPSQTPELDQVDPSGAGVLLRSRITITWCNTRMTAASIDHLVKHGQKKAPDFSEASFYCEPPFFNQTF